MRYKLAIVRKTSELWEKKQLFFSFSSLAETSLHRKQTHLIKCLSMSILFTLCPTTLAILRLIGLMVYLSALALAASVDWLAGWALSPCMPVLFIVLSQSAGLREARRTLALWQSYRLTSSLPQQIAPFRTNEWTCPLVNCHSFRQRNFAWNLAAKLCLICPGFNCAVYQILSPPFI